jgi:Ca2+-binding RTX toxin-like protein
MAAAETMLAQAQAPDTAPTSRIVPPAAGERVVLQVTPGTNIVLPDESFSPERARYVAEGDDLVVTLPDGGVLALVDFFAFPDDPATLQVGGQPPLPSTALIETVTPVDGMQVVQLAEAQVEPAAGPEAARPGGGGGAGFTPYDPGDIGPGLDPRGPLGPTALSFGVDFAEIESDPQLPDEAVAAEQPPPEPPPPEPPPPEPPPPENEAPSARVTAETTGGIGVESDPFQIPLAPAFPLIGEEEEVPPEQVNGLDPRLVTVEGGREISVSFFSQESAFRNSFGSFVIAPDGSFGDVRMLLPNDTDGRPGEVFSLGTVPAGSTLGFFIVSDGFRLNPERLFETPGRFELRNAAGEVASLGDTGGLTLVKIRPDGTERVVDGLVFVSADATPDSPDSNPLNPDGSGHVISGFDASTGTIIFSFDDRPTTGRTDRDFNDVVLTIQYGERPVDVAITPDLETQLAVDITDPDSSRLSAATAEISVGQGGDRLELVGFGDSNGDGLLDGTNIALTQVSESSVRLSGLDTVENYEAVLRGLTFDNDTSPPRLTDREVTVTVTDDQGAQSDPASVVIRLEDLVIDGDDGDNMLTGTDRSEGIAGGNGSDQIDGGSGNDVIDGGSGNDVIDAGDGEDIIFGGTGRDDLAGGAGADRFVIGSLVFGTETVRDFSRSEGDRLDLSDMFEGSDYEPGVSNDADYFRLSAIDGDGDGAANDIRVEVDLDGSGRDFTFQSVAVLDRPSGVTTSTPIDAIVNTQPPSDGATT